MGEIKINLLEVDLTTGENQVVDVTEDAKRYLGGNGLGSSKQAAAQAAAAAALARVRSEGASA